MRPSTITAWLHEVDVASDLGLQQQPSLSSLGRPASDCSRKRSFCQVVDVDPTGVCSDSPKRPRKTASTRPALAPASSSRMNTTGRGPLRRSSRTPSPNKNVMTFRDDETPTQPTIRQQHIVTLEHLYDRLPLQLNYAQSLGEEARDGEYAEREPIKSFPSQLSASASSAASSTSRNRSASPRKITDLSKTGHGVRYVLLRDGCEEELGKMGHSLHRQLYSVLRRRNSIGIFPAKLAGLLADMSDEQTAEIMQGNRLGPEDIEDYGVDDDDQRDALDVRVELEEMVQIIEAARVCIEERDPEAEWNHRVHSDVLKLVFGRKGSGQSVGFRNVYVFL